MDWGEGEKRCDQTEKEEAMTEKEEIRSFLMETIGEEGCGVSCGEPEIFRDERGWNMVLEGFMEPWYLGKTAQEAKASIEEYASMGFGLT